MTGTFHIPAAPQVWPQSERRSGPWSPAPEGLPVFGEVAPGAIYRSGQPTRDGFIWLVAHGFRSVVSLRAEGPGDALLWPSETAYLKLLRLSWVDEEAPTPEVAQDWLDYARRPELWPMLVHCKAGRGRTSVAAALCRFAFDGWEMQKAREEIELYRPNLIVARWPLAKPQKAFLAEWARAHQPSLWTAPAAGSEMGGL